MEKAIIKEVDGKQVASLIVEFELGEVENDGKNGTSVTLPMNMAGMERYFKQLLFERTSEGKLTVEEFEELLAEYRKMWLNDLIGVKSYPITINNGKIDGFKDDIEVVFEKGGN